MKRIDKYGATPSKKWTEGNAATGTPATVVSADFMNIIQEEIVGVIEAAAIEVDQDTDYPEHDSAQLKAALDALYLSKSGENLVDGSISGLTALGMAGGIDLNGNAITEAVSVSIQSDPVLSTHAARKSWVDSQVSPKLTKSGDTMSGSLDMGGNTITNAVSVAIQSDPVLGAHAARKSWVDSQVTALDERIDSLELDNVSQGYVDAGLAAKENTISAGTTAQYWRGDKSWQTLDKSAVGLGNVPNTDATSRANHTGTQTASTISDFEGAARTAVVASSISDGDTTHAPSGDAVFDALALKQDAITGAATSITGSDLTASKALVSDASGKVAASSVTATELGYLSGVTSAIQNQISGKQSTITGAATSITVSDLTASKALVSDASGKVAASTVTATELALLSGVTGELATKSYVTGQADTFVPPIEFAVLGTLNGITGAAALVYRVPRAFTVTAVRALVKTAGSAGNLVVDVKKKTGAGAFATILSSTISVAYTAGSYAVGSGTVSTTSLAEGDILSLDITSVQTNMVDFSVYVEVTRA